MLLFISINTVMSKNVARQNQSVQLHGVLVETSAYKMMCDASSSPDILIRPSFWLSPAASRLIPGGCSLKHLRKNILYSSGAVLWAAKRCNSLTPPLILVQIMFKIDYWEMFWVSHHAFNSFPAFVKKIRLSLPRKSIPAAPGTASGALYAKCAWMIDREEN